MKRLGGGIGWLLWHATVTPVLLIWRFLKWAGRWIRWLWQTAVAQTLPLAGGEAV